MAKVLIHADTNIDDVFRMLQANSDARFHAKGNQFEDWPLTEAELAELATYANYAEHAGDKMYVNGKHIERLIK